MTPYRGSEDDLLRALRDLVSGDPGRSPAPPNELAQAESDLGFHLPPFLRRVYEITNGGIGPGFGLYPIAAGEETLVATYRGFFDVNPTDVPWPERLLPIVEWGDAIWSCLDCRSLDGPIVTSSNGEPFANTGHTLRSWLAAWLRGVDVSKEMFEPGRQLTGINPFTREPIVIKGRGKPRGSRWP